MGNARFRITETVKHVLEQQCLGHLRLNAQFECEYWDDFSRHLWSFEAKQTPFCMYRGLSNDRHQAAMLHIENALHLHKTITFDFIFETQPQPVRILAVGDITGIDIFHYEIPKNEQIQDKAENTWELLDRMPVGILVVDIDTHKFEFINQHLEQVLGYSKDEISGKKLEKLHYPEDIANIQTDIQGMIDGKIHFSRPFRFIKKKGGSIVASVTQLQMTIEKKSYVVGILKDRKLINSQLIADYQNVLADEVLTSFPHSVMVFEDAGYLLRHHLKPTDQGANALPIQVGAHYTEIFPAFAHQQITEKFECLYRNRKECEWELSLTTENVIQVYRVRLFLLTKNYFLLILVDITKQKANELALKQSEKQFKDVFALNEAVMFMYDPESLQMVDVNNAALRFYGYERDAFLKLKLSDIKDSNSEIDEDIALIVTKTKNHFNFKHRLANGQVKEVEIFATTLEVNGKPLVCSIIQDITERQEYLHTIVEQNRLIRDIAWTHAHQLRAPISKLQALIEHLSNSDEQPYISTQRIQQELMGISRQIDATLSLLAEKTSSMEDMATQIPDFTKNPKSKIRKCEALVVDDDNIMLTLHSHLLKKSELFDNPKLFNSGESALEYLAKNDIPWLHFVVFLDLNMPEMNGWEFIHQTRKRLRNAQMYVVIVSSSIDPYEKEMAKSYEEIIEFISKPLQLKHMEQLRLLPVMQRLLPHA